LPEDCGGQGGYERLFEVLVGPVDEEHDALVMSAGRSADLLVIAASRPNASPESISWCASAAPASGGRVWTTEWWFSAG